jgi:hypothetical protein
MNPTTVNAWTKKSTMHGSTIETAGTVMKRRQILHAFHADMFCFVRRALINIPRVRYVIVPTIFILKYL